MHHHHRKSSGHGHHKGRRRSSDKHRRHSHQHDEDGHERRRSSGRHHTNDDESESDYTDYTVQEVDRVQPKQHKNFILMYPAGAQGNQGVNQQGQSPNVTVAQNPNRERIEVVIRQPPPQQIQFPPQTAQPQPIIINTQEPRREHNHWLAESSIIEPAYKKKRRDEEYQPVKISEGTGISMTPLNLYDQDHQDENVETDAQQAELAEVQKAKSIYNKEPDNNNKVVEFEENERPAEEDEAVPVGQDSLEVKRQYGDNCPLCGVGRLKEEFTWTGWMFALLCFPCGVFLLYSSTAVTCSHCRQVFHL